MYVGPKIRILACVNFVTHFSGKRLFINSKFLRTKIVLPKIHAMSDKRL